MSVKQKKIYINKENLEKPPAKWEAQVQGIFGIPIWVTEAYSFSAKEKRFIKKFYVDGDIIPNKGGNKTSNNSYILDAKELKDVRNFVVENMNAFWHGFFSVDSSIKIKLTQSWANYNEKNTHHHGHAHPNSLISAVLYVENTAPIIFERSVGANFWPQFHFKYHTNNVWNTTDLTVNTDNGVLLLFPSTTLHRVAPNTSENCRISISANSFPTGTLGEADKLTELKLDELKDKN
tara:strand:- start:1353 stop:2057 length:705 start_codon:yes stop_codon:yes gene_type:complete